MQRTKQIFKIQVAHESATTATSTLHLNLYAYKISDCVSVCARAYHGTYDYSAIDYI